MKNERKWTLYIHKSPSGKFYVGITSRKPNERWKDGAGYKYNTYFYRAINKYGFDNFEHIIFKENLTAKEAKELEIKMIAILRSNDRTYGYNITAGGEGLNGIKHSEETKKKISEAKKGKCVGESNFMYGKHHTAEAIRKMSEARKGKNAGENNHNYGKQPSKETRKKMSEAKKGKYNGENHPRARAVICIELDKYYSTTKEAAEFGVSDTNIRNAIKGKQKTAGGYHWRYATEEEIKAKRSLARAVNEHAS